MLGEKISMFFSGFHIKMIGIYLILFTYKMVDSTVRWTERRVSLFSDLSLPLKSISKQLSCFSVWI